MNIRTIFIGFMALFAMVTHAKQARTIYMSDRKTENITVCGLKATVIQFPTKPNKSFGGSQGLFSINYNENDILISALKTGAHSNLFVYMDGRRFGFDLKTSIGDCDEIILIKDAEEKRIRMKVRNE